MEELLLLQTANHFWHLKYAEILWTMVEPVLALKESARSSSSRLTMFEAFTASSS